MEKRLHCLDPSEKYYSGYNTQFGQGSFFFLSAAIIPHIYQWLPSFKERHQWWWHGMPDHKFGMLLKENKVSFFLNFENNRVYKNEQNFFSKKHFFPKIS